MKLAIYVQVHKEQNQLPKGALLTDLHSYKVRAKKFALVGN